MTEYELQLLLDTELVKNNVPGASLALLNNNSVISVSSGVLNLQTRVPVTTDSMFQVGSITKVLTATMMMILVDRDQLDLDQPIVCYLPDFMLQPDQDIGAITTRHLLTHTSGIDGDYFADTGRGEDALARYLSQCKTLKLIHPVGQVFSYCNTGFVIAGRMIEVILGCTWDQALRQLIFEPLGLKQSVTLSEHLVGKLAAIGHLQSKTNPNIFEPLPDAYAIPFSIGPAGATVTMSAGDLIKFAQMHIEHGRSAGGGCILAPGSVTQMQQSQVELPGETTWGKEAWGLGWSITNRGGYQVIGHDGNTDGQRAFLMARPEARVAMVLLTNGGAGIDLAKTLLNRIFAKAAGLPPLQEPSSQEVSETDLSIYTGFYQHSPGYTRVYVEGQELYMESFDAPDSESETFRLVAAGDAAFLCHRPPNSSPWFVQFTDTQDNQKATSLFSLYRRCPRMDMNSQLGLQQS